MDRNFIKQEKDELLTAFRVIIREELGKRDKRKQKTSTSHDLISQTKAANILNVCTKTIRNYENDGLLTRRWFRNRPHYRLKEVETLRERHSI